MGCETLRVIVINGVSAAASYVVDGETLTYRCGTASIGQSTEVPLELYAC